MSHTDGNFVQFFITQLIHTRTHSSLSLSLTICSARARVCKWYTRMLFTRFTVFIHRLYTPNHYTLEPNTLWLFLSHSLSHTHSLSQSVSHCTGKSMCMCMCMCVCVCYVVLCSSYMHLFVQCRYQHRVSSFSLLSSRTSDRFEAQHAFVTIEIP